MQTKKIRLIFKSHGKTSYRNLDVSDVLESEWRKYANETTKQRWPNLHGTLQCIEKRRDLS